MHNFLVHGGTFHREPDSVCKISYWHIPGGYDYVNAEVREVYFADLATAQKLTDKYSMPPAMAMLMMLTPPVISSNGDERYAHYMMRANPSTTPLDDGWNFWADWKAYKLDAPEMMPAGASTSSKISNAAIRDGWDAPTTTNN